MDDMTDCVKEAESRLAKEEPDSTPGERQVVAREMCRLLDSGILEEDLDRETVDIEYLIGRLEVREGDDNPTLEMKWDHWLGMMESFEASDYTDYQTQ